jgi:urease accessory protein
MVELATAESMNEGWQARLELRLEALQGRTRLAHCRHTGPLRVQRVFYPERLRSSAGAAPAESELDGGATPAATEPCHIYVLHPPGGLVSGDTLQIEVKCRDRAHALLTTPAATKFYRRRGQQVARVTQTLHLQGGTLEWLPQESIYYPDSAAQVCTRVHLDGAARFIGWELHCLGLPAIGAALGRGAVRATLELWLSGQPLLLERLALGGESLTARWGLAHFPAFGSCLAYPARTADLERVRGVAARFNCAELILACTIVDGVLCCRGLAQRVDHLKQAFTTLWCTLRPALLGREAIAPRIWAT